MIGYWQPKAGTARADWEDGLAYDRATGWFAVADGASTGSHSREWAYSLTHRFVSDRPADVFAREGLAAFLSWRDAVRTEFDPTSAQFDQSRAPEWVQALNRDAGAYATFLGGRIADGVVEAVAIGDTCLFHVRADGTWISFPVLDAADFDASPELLRSKRGVDDDARTLRHFRAPFGVRDHLYVATDALSHWILAHPVPAQVWDGLADIGHAGFAELCSDLLANGELKNDDVTLWRASPSLSGRRHL